jgi:hypothetical protein
MKSGCRDALSDRAGGEEPDGHGPHPARGPINQILRRLQPMADLISKDGRRSDMRVLVTAASRHNGIDRRADPMASQSARSTISSGRRTVTSSPARSSVDTMVWATSVVRQAPGSALFPEGEHLAFEHLFWRSRCWRSIVRCAGCGPLPGALRQSLLTRVPPGSKRRSPAVPAGDRAHLSRGSRRASRPGAPAKRYSADSGDSPVPASSSLSCGPWPTRPTWTRQQHLRAPRAACGVRGQSC